MHAAQAAGGTGPAEQGKKKRKFLSGEDTAAALGMGQHNGMQQQQQLQPSGQPSGSHSHAQKRQHERQGQPVQLVDALNAKYDRIESQVAEGTEKRAVCAVQQSLGSTGKHRVPGPKDDMNDYTFVFAGKLACHEALNVGIQQCPNIAGCKISKVQMCWAARSL